MIELPASHRDRVVAGVLVGVAVLFVALWIPRAMASASVGFAGPLTVPLVLLAADLVIAAALLTRWYPVRPVAQGLAVFGVLVHVLVALRSGPPAARACAGLLAVGHAWVLTALILLTAAEDDAAAAEDAGPDGPDGDSEDPPREPGDDAPRAVEITGEFRLEVPISDVVDLEPPARDPAADPTPEPAAAPAPYDQEEPTR